MPTLSEITVNSIDYHRNGVGGEGFWAVLFTHRTDRGVMFFLASVFDAPGHVSVVSVDLLPEHGVKFGLNSWRGDTFETALREAIARAQNGDHA